MPNKYGNLQAKQQEMMRETRNSVHPIWRGVGFVLIVLTPILGYFGTIALLEENARQKWFVIPVDLLAPGADPLLYVKIGMTLILAFLIYFIFQFISMVLFRLLGPSRYG
ncbi:MAG: hypothetical protein ACK4SN_07070, partial [Bellilinea sp.]